MPNVGSILADRSSKSVPAKSTRTFTPMPSITAARDCPCQIASGKIPATLRFARSTSLGHLRAMVGTLPPPPLSANGEGELVDSCNGSPSCDLSDEKTIGGISPLSSGEGLGVRASSISATDTAPTIVRRVICSGETRGRRITLISRAVPGGADHLRPNRPRPVIWSSVSTTDPLGAPPSAQSRAISLVLPTCISKRKGRAPKALRSRTSLSRSFTVRRPDVFDLRSLDQEFFTLTLDTIQPVTAVTVVDPGTFHVDCGGGFYHFATVCRPQIPHL